MRRAVLFAVVMAAVLCLAAPALAASGIPAVVTGSATNVTAATATVSGTVNLNGAALDRSGDSTDPGVDCYFEYGPTTSYGSTVACANQPAASGTTTVSADLTRLTGGSAYHYQLVVVYQGGLLNLLPTDAPGGDATFTAGLPVTLTLGSPSDLYSTTATLNGTVNAGGQTIKSCTFNYGTSPTALTSSASCVPSPSGTTDTPVSATLSGLTAATTYYYDLAVTTASGTVTTAPGSLTTTSTPPPAPTGTNPPTVQMLGNLSATLAADLNPNGVGVISCTFNYGTGTSYGSSAPCGSTPPATGGTVTAQVQGLTQGTLYHFDVVLSTGGGTFTSQDATFTTLDASDLPASNVTATSATVSAQVNPEGQTVTACKFLYAVSPNGQAVTVPCAQPVSGITGTSPVTVSAALTGLSANSTYIYAVEIQTTDGQAIGNLASFNTPSAPRPPTASTGAVTGLGPTVATLHATVDGNGSPSTGCEFEYAVTAFSANPVGSGATYGLDVACSPSPGTGTTNVSTALRGLVPNTTYYYRVLFATPGGYVIGATRSFHTPIGGGLGKPGAKITSAKLNGHTHRAVFRFRATGVGATRAQCALATVRGKRIGPHRFTGCRSPKAYSRLRAGTYEFYVRLGNGSGYGRAASRRFRI
jgi:hypothetical protein